jgi:hypothetical protein
MGDSKGWNSPQRGEGDSTGESEAGDSSTGKSEAWDGPQRGGEGSTGPQDQYCSSCKQKKPLIDFGRFLTCNTCRQRNRKVK